MIAGKNCCCTVPKRNWHVRQGRLKVWQDCCTVPKRNWHIKYCRLFHKIRGTTVVLYLRGIDTFHKCYLLFWIFVVLYLRGIDTTTLPQYGLWQNVIGCTVPKRNWHFEYQDFRDLILQDFRVVLYLREIDTYFQWLHQLLF